MRQTWDCPDARQSLGVYVLGAIDPAERALVDAHLLTCRDCRDELAGLAGLPALLARVNPDEVSRICADDAVRAGRQRGARRRSCSAPCSSLAEARRRRNRWRYLSAAAAVVVIAGGPVRRAEGRHVHDHHADAWSSRPGRAAGTPCRGRARPPG